ncbi:hypothetical protein RVR_P2106 (plasmid) [Actinacidiphila reveromycinica]|uniref:Uncharacterized protein n=1 Tax=Actinacidiphila reveromycinica TaxID=659352 RepID=A0A7U3VUC1_9ACTN|nr:hypothetical protein [Streptomyces sp. SN-593]BBG20789.1 hypothetical protein RVR_P2106 [Streptomyces sp. SN-593]
MVVVSPKDLREGDLVTIAGNTETVAKVTDQGAWIHVYTISKGGRPYLVRPYERVPLLRR